MRHYLTSTAPINLKQMVYCELRYQALHMLDMGMSLKQIDRQLKREFAEIADNLDADLDLVIEVHYDLMSDFEKRPSATMGIDDLIRYSQE